MVVVDVVGGQYKMQQGGPPNLMTRAAPLTLAEFVCCKHLHQSHSVAQELLCIS